MSDHAVIFPWVVAVTHRKTAMIQIRAQWTRAHRRTRAQILPSQAAADSIANAQMVTFARSIHVPTTCATILSSKGVVVRTASVTTPTSVQLTHATLCMCANIR